MSPASSSRPASRLVGFFEDACAAFQRATETAGVVEHWLEVAGYAVLLRFAGDALVPRVLPPLAHLAGAPRSNPDLTVCVGDTASTGVSLPASAWRADEHYFIRGIVRGYNRRPDPGAPEYVLNLLHGPRNLAVYWLPDAGRFPYLEARLPLALILYWWLAERSTLLIHSAAVGAAGAGALLGGGSGSGKSTTALACLLAGLGYAGDDYTLLRLEPSPRVFSIYNTAKVSAATAQGFPLLREFASRHGRQENGEVCFDIRSSLPQRLRNDLPLRAILLPRLAGRETTRIERTTAARALRAIAPSTILQLPGPRQEALGLLAEAVRRVPCYILELGTALERVPEAIAGLLESLPAPAAGEG